MERHMRRIQQAKQGIDMKRWSLHFSIIIILSGTLSNTHARDSSSDTIIYLLPGQGADCRLFRYIRFPYDTVHLELPVPAKKTSLHDYAIGLIHRIDLSRPFILIGVSFGGMICAELADTLEPTKTVVISSAKCRKELPGRYRFQKTIPLNKIIPKGMTKWGAKVLAPIVEPARKQDKETFRSMIEAKDPAYLKRTVDMIINWDKECQKGDIIHIHGDRDHTLPHRKVSYDYLVENGTHMMVYIRGEEINQLINKILQQ
jgi:pimeloyl-ACP methyl ester carboxylesterase